MKFQFLRANSPGLDADLLRLNVISWNQFCANNPLASHKEVKQRQADLCIEDDLPWQYQFTVTGEPIALDVSQLLSVVGRLDPLLFRYRHDTPDGLPRDLDKTFIQDSSSTALALVTQVPASTATVTLVTQAPGILAQRTKTLIEAILVDVDAPLKPFLQISDKHIAEMGTILRSVNDQVRAVKDRMDELQKGETTEEKIKQVDALLDIEDLTSSSAFETLTLIYEICTKKSDFGVHISQIQRMGRPRGHYFFLNLDAKFN